MNAALVIPRKDSAGNRAAPAPRAFSLVELVIVIVIIGIIAAIAVPRVSHSAAGAGDSAVRQNLKVLRSAIDRYAAEHHQMWPGMCEDGQGGGEKSADAFIRQLTQYSDDQGLTSRTPSAEYKFGPYVREIPPAPVGAHQGSRNVTIDSTASPPLVQEVDAGWVYNPLTGEIIVNTDAANQDGSHTYDEY
jgi:prepilin-type N-terminal cleavage/methylation domain-containing protein